MTTTTYAEIMGFTCCRPNCSGGGFGNAIDTHHIFPQRRGGPDEAWNYIAVCKRCHRVAERMSRNGQFVALFSWKARAEINKYGFCFDERDDNDCKKLNALLHSRGLPPARYIQANPLSPEPINQGTSNSERSRHQEDVLSVAPEKPRKTSGRIKQRKNKKKDASIHKRGDGNNLIPLTVVARRLGISQSYGHGLYSKPTVNGLLIEMGMPLTRRPFISITEDQFRLLEQKINAA